MKIDVKDVTIRKCLMNDVNDIYQIQTKVIDDFKEEEKGFFLPFLKSSYERIVTHPASDGEIYGAFYQGKMIAWIFLSVNDRMRKIQSYVPKIVGSCADIDGVIVLKEYRGNGLQKKLIQYLEEEAKKKKIDNVVAEVTVQNDYSLKNLEELGYTIKGEYQKNETIKRHILVKNLNKK